MKPLIKWLSSQNDCWAHHVPGSDHMNAARSLCVFVRSLANHVITLMGWKMVTLETEASLFCVHISAELELSRQKLLLWRVHLTLASAPSVPRGGGGGGRLFCPSPFPHVVERLKSASSIKGCSFLAKLSRFLTFSWQLFSFISGSGLLPACSDRPSGMKGNRWTKQTFIYLFNVSTQTLTGDDMA